MIRQESYIHRRNGTRRYILGIIRDSIYTILTIGSICAAYYFVVP